MSTPDRQLQPLSRCPWCQGTAFVSGEVRTPGGSLTWRGVCLGCGASGPVAFTSAEARTRWHQVAKPENQAKALRSLLR